jgi:hypothetical protein
MRTSCMSTAAVLCAARHSERLAVAGLSAQCVWSFWTTERASWLGTAPTCPTRTSGTSGHGHIACPCPLGDAHRCRFVSWSVTSNPCCFTAPCDVWRHGNTLIHELTHAIDMVRGRRREKALSICQSAWANALAQCSFGVRISARTGLRRWSRWGLCCVELTGHCAQHTVILPAH